MLLIVVFCVGVALAQVNATVMLASAARTRTLFFFPPCCCLGESYFSCG